jgi:hypothetical protein
VSRTAGARPANDIESFVRSASETLHHEKQPH